jgi:hypothetical protein
VVTGPVLDSCLVDLGQDGRLGAGGKRADHGHPDVGARGEYRLGFGRSHAIAAREFNDLVGAPDHGKSGPVEPTEVTRTEPGLTRLRTAAALMSGEQLPAADLDLTALDPDLERVRGCCQKPGGGQASGARGRNRQWAGLGDAVDIVDADTDASEELKQGPGQGGTRTHGQLDLHHTGLPPDRAAHQDERERRQHRAVVPRASGQCTPRAQPPGQPRGAADAPLDVVVDVAPLFRGQEQDFGGDLPTVSGGGRRPLRHVDNQRERRSDGHGDVLTHRVRERRGQKVAGPGMKRER